MSVLDFEIQSSALNTTRAITVFLPPNYSQRSLYPVVYCADGQAVSDFADTLQFAIKSEGVPPVILIGVHSVPEFRPREYLLGVDSERYDKHELFFTSEVPNWAFKQFSIDKSRDSTAILGFSNGAAFALTAAAKFRQLYGAVIAFSIAGGANRVAAEEYAKRPIARYYLSAGTREIPFYRTTLALEKIFQQHAVQYTRTERLAGHDLGLWCNELPLAIRWAFSNSC